MLLNPSALTPLDVQRFPTASLPIATLPLSGNEIVSIEQGGRNVYITVFDLVTQFLGQGWHLVSSGPYTALAVDRLFVDTSSNSVTVNLPGSPVIGNTVYFVDFAGTWGVNALTVGRNGSLIMGLAQDMTVTIARGTFGLTFSGADWRLTE